MKRWVHLALLVATGLGGDVLAHGGGLDSNGGHNNRKTGGYHCHRCPCGCAKPAPPPKQTREKATPTATPTKAAPKKTCSIEIRDAKTDLEVGAQTSVTLVTGVSFSGELASCSAEKLELRRVSDDPVTIKALEIKSVSQ